MKEQRARPVPRPFAFEWGKGEVVEEATFAGPYHEPSIQLLEYEDGSRSVRFCYYDHAGRFQRSPLMIREADIGDLRAALRRAPKLRAMLRRALGT
jgi:hypothetical protein